MECLKVHLEIVPVDIRSGVDYYDEVRYGKLRVAEDGESSVMPPNSERIRYMRHEVRRSADKSVRQFLVRVDEKEIFQDLLHISDETVNALLQRNREEVFSDGRRSMWSEIRALPWYRRLFKRF
jgi:hypothetical protein